MFVIKATNKFGPINKNRMEDGVGFVLGTELTGSELRPSKSVLDGPSKIEMDALD